MRSSELNERRITSSVADLGRRPVAMSSVTIKFGGKPFPLDVDLSASALTFKEQIYAVTGVPVDRSVESDVGRGVLHASSS